MTFDFLHCVTCKKKLTFEDKKQFHAQCSVCYKKPLQCPIHGDMILDERGVTIYKQWTTSAWYCLPCDIARKRALKHYEFLQRREFNRRHWIKKLFIYFLNFLKSIINKLRSIYG